MPFQVGDFFSFKENEFIGNRPSSVQNTYGNLEANWNHSKFGSGNAYSADKFL
jgi:hypothetical protein